MTGLNVITVSGDNCAHSGWVNILKPRVYTEHLDSLFVLCVNSDMYLVLYCVYLTHAALALFNL